MRTTQMRFVWAKFSFITLEQVELLHSTVMPSHWLSLIWRMVQIHTEKVTTVPSWRRVRRWLYKGNCVRGANAVQVTLGLLAKGLENLHLSGHPVTAAVPRVLHWMKCYHWFPLYKYFAFSPLIFVSSIHVYTLSHMWALVAKLLLSSVWILEYLYTSIL